MTCLRPGRNLDPQAEQQGAADPEKHPDVDLGKTGRSENSHRTEIASLTEAVLVSRSIGCWLLTVTGFVDNKRNTFSI